MGTIAGTCSGRLAPSGRAQLVSFQLLGWLWVHWCPCDTISRPMCYPRFLLLCIKCLHLEKRKQVLEGHRSARRVPVSGEALGMVGDSRNGSH